MRLNLSDSASVFYFVCVVLFYHLIDVGEVSSLVVVVKAIAYDEVVLDVEAAVVNLEIYFQAVGFHEE